MSTQSRLLTVFAASTLLAGAAYAADQVSASPPNENAAQSAADRDVGKLSADGAAAFRDLHMTRLAIFNADPAEAKTLIAKAQTELDRAKTDDKIFTKAEADLKQPAATAKSTTTETKNNPDASKPIAWLPIDGQLALGDDYVATPQKAAAVDEANKSLTKGDQKGALEKLKLADVNVSFTMAVAPLATSTSDVDQAVTLINDGKYYEANAVLKKAEDGIRFDVVDVNEVPKTQQAQQASSDAKGMAAKSTPDTTKPATDTTKPAK